MAITIESRINLQDNSPNDDFIRTFNQLVGYLRWFGIPWGGSRMQRIWSDVVTAGIFIGIICSTNRMLSDKFTGKVFLKLTGTAKYTSSFLSLLTMHRLRLLWPSLMKSWETSSYCCGRIGLPNNLLRVKLITVAIGFVILSTVERLFTVLSSESVRITSTLTEFLRDYIIKSQSYIISSEQYTTVFGVIIFLQILITTLISNLDDFIIIAFSMALASRQKYLNQLLKSLCEKHSYNYGIQEISPITVTTHNNLTWRKVREAFVRYTHLVQQVDNAVGPLILLSVFSNLIYIMMIIFALNYKADTYVVAYYIYALVWLGIRCVAVLLTAANIHDMSQHGMEYLKTIKTTSYDVEVQRLQFQLSKNEIALSGMGFFRLKRSLILKALSVIITYDLILLQYNDRLSQE